MGNVFSKVFTQNSSITIPAEVSTVTVIARVQVPAFNQQFWGFIDAYKNLYTLGANNNGQIGNGGITPQSIPVLAFSNTAIIQAGGSGNNDAYALSPSGQAYGWGSNSSGELGIGNQTAQSTPVAVVGNLRFTQMFIASNFATFLAQNGSLYSVGRNQGGQLGDGTISDRSSPVLVVGGLKFTSSVASINTSSASIADVIAVANGGAAYAWGLNTKGILGDGTTVAKSSPVAVAGGLTFSQIYMGLTTSTDVFAIGLTTAGAAYCWGANTNGNLGDGTTVAKSSPVAVVGGLVFSQVACGQNGECYGLTAAGAVYSWGSNALGQLGDGTITSRSSPVLVVGGLVFSSISVGQGQGTVVTGITSAGSAYCWGSNFQGVLGDGTNLARSSPVAVVGGLAFSSIVVTVANSQSSFAYGVTTGGALYAWGNNSQGFLGDGTTVSKSSPILISGSLQGSLLDDLYRTTIAVVPGNTYAINFLGQGAIGLFGTTPIGKGNISSVTVMFDQ